MCQLPSSLKKVVIVEDEIIIARVFEVYFENSKVESVLQFSTAEAFIKALDQVKEADIILMDVQLGGEMDGIEAAKKLRAISDLPIIFTTGNEYSESYEATQSIQNTKILNKPINFEKLCKAINTILIG